MKQKQKSKKFLILGLFLFGITLLLWNCTIEDNAIEPESIDLSNVKTVSFKDAIAQFNSKKEKIKQKKVYAKSTENELEITPDWNTLEYNKIAYTNAQLTTANSKINRNGKYSSQLYFINVNNHIKTVIFTIWKDEVDANGNIVNGRIYFNNLEGKFIDGYRIEKGVFTKRFVIKKQYQKASFLPLFLFQEEEEQGGCWNTDSLKDIEGGVFDEVVVTAYLESSGGENGGRGNEGGIYYTYGNSYGSYINGATSNGLYQGGGSSSLSSGQVTSAAAAILMVAPIEPDQNGNCPDGYKKNPTTGKCESICTGGKFYNETSKKCECPDGMVEDDNGNCVIDPCNQIKRLVQNNSLGSNILPIVNQLRTKLGATDNEWSISYKNKWVDGTRKNVPDDNGIKEGPSNTRSYLNSGNTWVGQIHTHPQDTYSIFSWLDIRAIMLLHKDSHDNFNDEVFLMVVTPNNVTYTLKVDNILTLINKIDADMQNAVGNTDEEKRGKKNMKKALI